MLVTRQTGNRRYRMLFLVLPFIALLFTQGLVGCSSASQAQADARTSSASPQQTARTPGEQATNPPALDPTQKSGAQTTPTVPAFTLHGPTNFLLNMPLAFSSVNGITTTASGATTQLNATKIKTEITQELRHLLFVVDSDNNIKVYSQGAAPISTRLAFNPDGSLTISYTQTANSEAGTVSILFSGVLSKKQIAVNYEQQYTPSMLINAQASDVVVAFNAPVKWVAPNEIPAAPGNGTYQLTEQGGIKLAWSAGQNAVAYDVYRLISDDNQQFQELTTVKGTSYSDNSSAAIKNTHATKGITYAIFSVGPTGVENPGGVIISV